MTTGERISKLRESRNILQKELAKAIKIDPVVLNRIEKGKRSTRDEELRRIADYFDVTTDYLLGRESKVCFLSKKQSALLDIFDGLNDEGQNTAMNVLNGLNLLHAKKSQKVSGVVQNNKINNNFGVIGGNFNAKVTIGG